jgi:hypothetical protein
MSTSGSSATSIGEVFVRASAHRSLLTGPTCARRHMVLPYLDFLIQKKVTEVPLVVLFCDLAGCRARSLPLAARAQLYNVNKLIESKLNLCQQTLMVGSVEDEYKRLNSKDYPAREQLCSCPA